MKAGWKTTEFWVTLLVVAGAVKLYLDGEIELAAGLLGAAGIGYPLARGQAKRGQS